jgi:signal peptidase
MTAPRTPLAERWDFTAEPMRRFALGSACRRAVTVPIRATRVALRVLQHLLFLAAVVTILAIAVPALLGQRIMAVTSGSMEPAIRVGDAVLVKPASVASIRPGDVVTFRNPNGSGMTTHRVLALKDINGSTYLQTQGDANADPDVDLTSGKAVVGVVGMRFPGMGPWLVHATSRWGKVILLGIPALLLMLSEIGRLMRSRAPRGARAETPVDAPAFRASSAPSSPAFLPVVHAAPRTVSGPRTVAACRAGLTPVKAVTGASAESLRAFRELREGRQRLGTVGRESIRAACDMGHGSEQFAPALGLTRQAARHRWGRPAIPQPNGQDPATGMEREAGT